MRNDEIAPEGGIPAAGYIECGTRGRVIAHFSAPMRLTGVRAPLHHYSKPRDPTKIKAPFVDNDETLDTGDIAAFNASLEAAE